MAQKKSRENTKVCPTPPKIGKGRTQKNAKNFAENKKNGKNRSPKENSLKPSNALKVSNQK